MNCVVEEYGEKREDGRIRMRCVNCGTIYNYTMSHPEDFVAANCPGGDKEGACKRKERSLQSYLTRPELQALFPEEDDPTLIGNRLKEIFFQIGIPPCGGCETRAHWLNQANILLRKGIAEVKKILQ